MRTKLRGFLIAIVVEPATLKKSAPKNACTSDLFLLVVLHMTFRIIMSIHKSYHMPFRKLIPPHPHRL